MSILHPLSKEEIRREFTHYGWFGFCPVYLAEEGFYGMNVIERNGIPEWLFGAAEIFMSMMIFILSIVWFPDEPQWGFIVTGEIPR